MMEQQTCLACENESIRDNIANPFPRRQMRNADAAHIATVALTCGHTLFSLGTPAPAPAPAPAQLRHPQTSSSLA
jgi:hypothetical protein